MLTRHKPFQGENLTVVSHRIVYDHFTPPKEYAKDLPPGVEQVLDRALDKDPARRYQRAKDMADDLRRMLSAARDDLNETLSIASWAPGTQPPHATPPGGVTMVSPVAAIPQAAAKPAAPAAPKKPRQPMSPRRLFLSAGVAAVVAILAAAAILLGISWSGGSEKPPAEPVQDVAATRFAALVKAGERYRDTLKYPEAIQALKQALPLAPEAERPRIQLMIEDSEERLANFIANQSRAEQIVIHMVEARLAMQDGRFTDAIVAADAVLLLEPEHAEATQVRIEAQKGMAKLRERTRTAPGQPTPREQIATVVPQPVAPSATPQQPAETIAQPAKLRISLNSEMGEPTVRITLGNKTIFNETFRGKRTRFLRKAEPFSDERTIELDAGLHDLQVIVAPGGGAKGRTVRRSGNF